jgi:hypothetical protein
MTELHSAEAARVAADRYRRELAGFDPELQDWAAAAAGEPVLVHTLERDPSYWVVPVEGTGGLVGFVRVSADGEPVASGRLGTGPVNDPPVVTWITAEQAAEKARAEAGPEAIVSHPLYVHDGPPGREGWLVETREPDGRHRVLLVTHGGVGAPRGDTDPLE